MGDVFINSFLIKSAKIISKQGIKNIILYNIQSIFLNIFFSFILLHVFDFNDILNIMAKTVNTVIIIERITKNKSIFVVSLNNVNIYIKNINKNTKNIVIKKIIAVVKNIFFNGLLIS